MKIITLGAGEQGRVVKDLLEDIAEHEFYGFLDDSLKGKVDGAPILGKSDNIENYLGSDYSFIIALGNNHHRAKLFERIEKLGGNLETIIHPTARISKDAHLEKGCFLGYQAFVANGVRVGKGAILDNRSTIEHDCNIGDYVNISPGSLLVSGNNRGRYSHTGASSTIGEDVSVGENCIIGTGSLVLSDVPDSRVAFGHPAKIKGEVSPTGEHRLYK